MVVLSPLAWPGGKAKQAPNILSYVPQHRTWVEVFGGSLSVTLQKDRALTSEIEVCNDIQSHLIRFWRVYQAQGLDFIETRMRYLLNSRSEWNVQKYIMNDPTADEEERAFAYYYTLQNSVNKMGKVWSYNITAKPQSLATRADFERNRQELELAYKRLQGVQIECMEYAKLIKVYGVDRQTFFYLDPPYFIATQNPTSYYGDQHSFGVDDHITLARLLKQTPALWILSYDDHPDVHELYRDFNILSYEYQGTMNSGGQRNQRREVLIMNYDPLAEGVQGRLL